MTDGPKPWLWLFSSNQRALYAQDVSNVAALPAGAKYQFRYKERWVHDALKADWRNKKLVGCDVIVVFSYQHTSHFHPPAFIPVRLAKVADTEVEGTVFVIKFEVTQQVSLPESAEGGDFSPGALVRQFSRAAEALMEGVHPGGTHNRSAVLAPSPEPLLSLSQPGSDRWERTVDYLAASTAFPDHLFFRITELREVGGTKPLVPKAGKFELVAGKTYELGLSHYQPTPPSELRRLEVVTDPEVLDIHGSTTVTISSGYDAIRVRFHAAYRDNPKDSTLTVEASSGSHGSRAPLNVRVLPPKNEKVFRGVAGAAVILLAGLPGLVNDFQNGGRVLAGMLVLSGAGLASYMTVRSRVSLPKG